MSDPEIITLSSDEDTKPVVRMQLSKRKRGKGDVNPTASKKIALQFQASCSSKTQNVQTRRQFHLKSSVMSKNETRTVALPVYKHQNVTQNGNIHNQRFSSKLPSSSSLYKFQNTTQNGNIHNQHFPSTLSSCSSMRGYKDGKLQFMCSKSTYVSEKQFANTKSVRHLQKQYNNSADSNSSHTLRTSMTTNFVMNVNNSRTSDSVNFIQKSNGKQSENSSNKMNIPLSVLSALREKGISITNVDEKPKSNVTVYNKQLESQKYLNKLKSSLRKSNTNINVVPKANTAPSFSTFPKANGISHDNVHELKNAIKGSSSNLSKYQNEKKVLPLTQSMSNKYAKDIPFKFSSEIKIIEKPATVIKSVTVTNDKKFVHNSAQKDLLCFPKPLSASSQLTRKDSMHGSFIQIPSRTFSITPIGKPKNNFDKSVFPPEINIIKVDNSKQNKKTATPCFTSIPTSISATSSRTVNSSVKFALNTNNKKTSPAVKKKSSLQSDTKKHYKPCIIKNVDLLNGRDTLLTLLSLCDDNKNSSCVVPATYISNSNLSIVPVTSESLVCHSEIKPISPLIKSMKLKDVASETHNWPRLIVSLERLNIHRICTKEKISVPSTVTGVFDLSEMNNKYSIGQKSKEFGEKICSDYHSVKSNDDHLSTSISSDKFESSVVSENSNTCISIPEIVTGPFGLPETDDKYSNGQELEEFGKKIPADYHSIKSEHDHLPTSISSDKSESSVVLMNSVDTSISVPKTISGAFDLAETNDKHSNEQELEEFCEKISADYHSVKTDDNHLPTSISGDKSESSVVLMNSVDTSISVPKTISGAFDLAETNDKHSNEQELEEFCEKISADYHSVKTEDDHLPTSISGDKSESSVVLMNSVDTCISVPKAVTGAFDLSKTDDKHSNEQKFEEFCGKISADCHSIRSEDDHLATSILGDKSESSVVLMNSVGTLISVCKKVTGTFDLSEMNKDSNGQELEEFCEKMPVDCHSKSEGSCLPTSISGDKESSVVLMNSVDTYISVPKTVSEAFHLSETDNKYSNEQELEEFCEKVSADCHSGKSEKDHLSTDISGDKTEASLVLMNSISTYLSDDARDENLKISREPLCTISNILKAETADSSSHVASLDSVMTFKKDNNNMFVTVDTLHATDPSQCIEMKILTENSSKNSGNLMVNPNSNDISKAKSILLSDIDNYFIPNYDINSNEVRNLLHSIILKVCNMQFKENQNTCLEVLNIIISTIENLSDSLLTETESVTNIQSACQLVKHAPTEKLCNVLSDNVCEDIIKKSSTIVHTAVDNGHCIEICKENKERKTLSFHVSPNIEEKLSDYLTVPNQHLGETNISLPIDENINMCHRTDVNINSDIINKSILSKESPKEIFNKTNFNLTSKKNKYQENKIVSDESVLKNKTDNTESLSFNFDVIEQKADRSEISEFMDSDNEMDFTISSRIAVEGYNQMKSSKDDACFQDDNALISVSPLRENGALTCIIVQVESRQDLFTEKEEHFEGDSEFKQNICIEQDNMGFNDEEPEPCMSLFSFTEDTSTSDKYACSFTDDEGKNTLNQVDSTQVTSPKLSLKRNRSIESPDGKLMANDREYFVNNGFKRIKLNESVLSTDQETLSSSDKNPVPLNETLEEKNTRKFMELLEYSKILMGVDSSEEEKDKIARILIKKLGETEPWYVGSEKFSAQIESTTNELKRMVDNVFTILTNLRQEFKKYKIKSKFGINRENSQDTNLACCSSSVSNDFVERNTKETAISENMKISTFKINTDEISDSIETSSHTFLQNMYKPKTSENSVFVNNTVDKGSHALETVLSSTIESSSSKNAMCDNQLNSVATSLTSKHNSLTSNFSMQLVTKSNTSDKDNIDSFDLLQSLNSHEPLTVADDITDINMHLRPSTSKDDSYSSKNDTKTSFPDTNYSNKQHEGKINSKLPTFLTVGKTNHAISVLKKEKVVKANPRSSGDCSAAHIKRLEKMLQKLDKKIKKLQERELSLDDLDDEGSAYIQEESYKKRFMKVWNCLCKLKKQSSRTGRVVDKKFKYEGSRYKPINVAVEKMINRRKAHEKFPNYNEVLSLIKQVNEFENIGLNEKHVESEATNVFKDIGKELQSRRCRDFEDLFGCHLTDNFDPVNDPAEHDETLKKILNENKQSFERSIDQVIDSYADLQSVTPEDEDNQDNSSEEEDDQEERDKDLPLTDPASPNSDSLDSCKNDVTEIVNESDKSTDPNEEIMKKEDVKTESNATEVNPISVESNRKLFLESIVIEDSNSSDDLPSIQDVMGTR